MRAVDNRKDELGGNLRSGRPGRPVATIPQFAEIVPQVYNKVTSNRLLGAPLLAATHDWKGFLDGRMNEIGGITTSLRKDSRQKNAEPHEMYIFKNRQGKVAFQYKTKYDITMQNDWQGGDDGIPLFKVCDSCDVSV